MPEHLSSRLDRLPEHRMGVHRVTVKLLDGRTFSPVLIAWEMEIVRVEGSEDIPFAEADIADMYEVSPAPPPSGPRSLVTIGTNENGRHC